jgi:hypothetical protein
MFPFMDAQVLLQRYDSLKTLRQPLEKIWEECYDFTYPLRGIGFSNSGLTPVNAQWSRARDKQARLYDVTATTATRLLASSLLSGLTPANSQWFSLDVYGSSQEERAWLEEASHLTWQNIHASNYSEVAFEGFIDAVISGQFAVFVREGQDRPFEFSLWPLSQLYFTSSTRSGNIDTSFYSFGLTKSQAVNEYGDGCCRHVGEEKDEDAVTEFVQAIFPDPTYDGSPIQLPIKSIHVCCKCKQIVKSSGFNEAPLIIPRLMTMPNTPYAHGMVYEALPTIKTLNKLVETLLGSADMAVSGMWGAVDDGVLNPKTITVGPRKIITVASKDSLFPLTPQSDFNVAQWMVEGLKADIKRMLMSDQLQPQDGPAMTATEVHARVGIIRQQLGPNYERLQDEFLRPLVNRCFGIAFRKGVFSPPPKSLLGRPTRVTYQSPLARAQQMEEVQAMERYEASLGQQAQMGHPEGMDWYNWDEASKRKALLMSVPATTMQPDKAVEQIRAERAKQMEQQKAEMMAAEGQKNAG